MILYVKKIRVLCRSSGSLKRITFCYNFRLAGSIFWKCIFTGKKAKKYFIDIKPLLNFRWHFHLIVYSSEISKNKKLRCVCLLVIFFYISENDLVMIWKSLYIFISCFLSVLYFIKHFSFSFFFTSCLKYKYYAAKTKAMVLPLRCTSNRI